MNKESGQAGQIEDITGDDKPEFRSLFVSFAYKGTDNGMDKTGFDSRVLQIPVDVAVGNAGDVKAIADALAESEFSDAKRYAGLEITLISIQPLPV